MDHLDVDWEYEPQGYVVDGRPYLPDFLVWPDTELAFWLEIKGQFPGQDELDAARGLAEGTQIPAIVYWGKPQPPAPDLDYLTHDAYCGWDQEDGYIWADERGRLPYPTRPPAWQLDLTPTAFHFNKVNKASIESGFWWWTDCPFCGKALIKLHGQVGSCPSNAHLDLDYLMDKYGPPYPRFAHRTERLLQAYEAARSARFEHGENGA